MKLARISFLMVILSASASADAMLQRLRKAPNTAILGLRASVGRAPLNPAMPMRFCSNQAVTTPLTFKAAKAERDALVAKLVKDGACSFVYTMFEKKEKRYTKPLTQENFNDLSRLYSAYKQARNAHFVSFVKDNYSWLMHEATREQLESMVNRDPNSIRNWGMRPKFNNVMDNLSKLALASKILEDEKNKVEAEIAQLPKYGWQGHDSWKNQEREIELLLIKEDLGRKNDELVSLYEEYIKADSDHAKDDYDHVNDESHSPFGKLLI